MATPRKMHFDVDQRVRLTTTCDGLHPDGAKAVRVGAGTLVEVVKQIVEPDGSLHYIGRYAQRIGHTGDPDKDWAFGSLLFDFRDATTQGVVGKPLFPGNLDKGLGIRPQDGVGTVKYANSGLSSAGGFQNPDADRSAGRQGENSVPAAGQSGDEASAQPGGGTSPSQQQQQQQQQDSQQDSQQAPGETTSTETTTMTTATQTTQQGPTQDEQDEQDAADALAEALARMAQSTGQGQQGNGGQDDDDLEKRVARLETIEQKGNEPARKALKALIASAQKTDADLRALTPPLTAFMSQQNQQQAAMAARVATVETELGKMAKSLADGTAGGGAPQQVVHVFQTPTVTITTKAGDRPEVVETLRRVGLGLKNILWVGPAGSGKTRMAETIAARLNVPVGDQSCSPGMSETVWTGRMVPNITTGQSTYTPSLFVTLFETGGVFLADEQDNADASTLLLLNAALANGYITLPDGRRITRHPDFVFIGAANTYGNGADRMYVGRAALDKAYLDRFIGGVLTVDYDKTIELAICGGTGDKTTAGELYKQVVQLRKAASKAGIQEIVSTRWVEACVKLIAGGATIPEAFRLCAEPWSASDRQAAGIAA